MPSFSGKKNSEWSNKNWRNGNILKTSGIIGGIICLVSQVKIQNDQIRTEGGVSFLKNLEF